MLLMPIERTRSSTERVETPWMPLLDHRGQRLLRQPPRLQDKREVAALAKLRDPQLDGLGAGLPITVAVAVALRQPLGALLAVRRAGELANLQVHQPLRGEADHLTQQIGVTALLHRYARRDHVDGQFRSLGLRFVSANPTLAEDRG